MAIEVDINHINVEEDGHINTIPMLLPIQLVSYLMFYEIQIVQANLSILPNFLPN